MEKCSQLADSERQEIISEAAARKGLTPAIIEKDFWVCWVLKRIFEDDALSAQLIFKGGTSLSKAFNIIERFSEDIDLILDWRKLTSVDPQTSMSRNKQNKLNDEIGRHSVDYIAKELLPKLSNILAPQCACLVDTGDPNTINVSYPAAFPDTYLRSEVRLEIGPLAAWSPYKSISISPYAAQELPTVFVEPTCQVNTTLAERTFWEKITILHHEAHRPEGSIQPARYSRHYYDVYMMLGTAVKENAMADLVMLATVVQFKQRFYPRGWANYDLAKPGTLKLIPEPHLIKSLSDDYRNMQNMIFGEYPPFQLIVQRIAEFETEINAM